MLDNEALIKVELETFSSPDDDSGGGGGRDETLRIANIQINNLDFIGKSLLLPRRIPRIHVGSMYWTSRLHTASRLLSPFSFLSSLILSIRRRFALPLFLVPRASEAINPFPT